MSAVVLLPWSDAWPAYFQTIRAELTDAFAPDAVAVEHIGSTSVPGLAAKPVLDVLLGTRSLAEIEANISRLEALGYDYVARHEKVLPERRYFVKAPTDALRVHVHGVVQGSSIWRAHIAFRDALRTDADLCARYQILKIKLAAEHAADKTAYTDAKAPFIQSVLAATMHY